MKKIYKITFYILTTIVVLPVFSLFIDNQKDDSVFVNTVSADVPAVVVPPQPAPYDYSGGGSSGDGSCDSGGADGGGGSGCDGAW